MNSPVCIPAAGHPDGPTRLDIACSFLYPPYSLPSSNILSLRSRLNCLFLARCISMTGLPFTTNGASRYGKVKEKKIPPQMMETPPIASLAPCRRTNCMMDAFVALGPRLFQASLNVSFRCKKASRHTRSANWALISRVGAIKYRLSDVSATFAIPNEAKNTAGRTPNLMVFQSTLLCSQSYPFTSSAPRETTYMSFPDASAPLPRYHTPATARGTVAKWRSAITPGAECKFVRVLEIYSEPHARCNFAVGRLIAGAQWRASRSKEWLQQQMVPVLQRLRGIHLRLANRSCPAHHRQRVAVLPRVEITTKMLLTARLY